MEFPYGHHHHHHQHHERRDEEEERYGRYPPPINDEPTWPPPAQAFQPPTYPPPNRFDSESNYPSVHHVSHHHYQPEPEPDYASVHHVSHESHPHFRPEHEPGYASVHHVSHESHPHFRPEHEPGYASVHHVSHQSHQGFDPVPYAEFRPETYPHSYHGHEGSGSELLNKPTCRVYSKAETGYSLTIRDGHVILARANENDPFQHWIKYEKFSTKVKDQEGFPSFSLVNKATGQAMKHSIGATQPVQLIPYNPDVLDESVLWTESKDLGDGYRAIRMVNNIRLNLDAFNGDQNHGGVHDGTTIVLWEWKKGDNQRWRISPN